MQLAYLVDFAQFLLQFAPHLTFCTFIMTPKGSLTDDLYSHAKKKSCYIPYIYEHSVIQERDD